MKKLLLLAAISVAMNATPLTVFNTGVDAASAVLPAGSVDPHYVSTSPVLVLANVNPAWIPNSSVSKWIAPDANDGGNLNGGNYAFVYRTTVDLTGFIPGSAAISGRWSTDNTGIDILLNGTSTGNTSSTFASYSNFALNSGFVAGLNTIDFSWSNAGGPGGLRVEFLSAEATAVTAGAIPEPGTIMLLLGGVAGLAFLRRK